MGSSGGFPIDIVLFGMIAAFLVLRLRNILGRRQGFERPVDPRVAAPADARPSPIAPESPVVEAVAEPAHNLPDPASPAGLALVRMQAVDRQFSPGRFLEGAQAAFRIIVTAFAAGDRGALRSLLSDDTYKAFDTAIAAREAASGTQRTEIRGIGSATIETAELRDTVASITVRFVSDQVNVTVGTDGQPTQGTDAVTEIADIWTFERNLTSTDPTWRLVAARSA